MPARKTRSQVFSTAMARSAERRRCPECGRKSALVSVPRSVDDIIAAYCRWDDCHYARLRDA